MRIGWPLWRQPLLTPRSVVRGNSCATTYPPGSSAPTPVENHRRWRHSGAAVTRFPTTTPNSNDVTGCMTSPDRTWCRFFTEATSAADARRGTAVASPSNASRITASGRRTVARLPRRNRTVVKPDAHRKHEDTKTQRPGDYPATSARSPQITQMNTDGIESQRARHQISAPARFPAVGQRPGTGGQGNDSYRKRSASLPCSPACALYERRPRLHLFLDGGAPPSRTGVRGGGTDAPSARRPVGSAAATDACVRRRRASLRLPAIERLPAVPPSITGTNASRRR